MKISYNYRGQPTKRTMWIGLGKAVIEFGKAMLFFAIIAGFVWLVMWVATSNRVCRNMYDKQLKIETRCQ